MTPLYRTTRRIVSTQSSFLSCGPINDRGLPWSLLLHLSNSYSRINVCLFALIFPLEMTVITMLAPMCLAVFHLPAEYAAFLCKATGTRAPCHPLSFRLLSKSESSLNCYSGRARSYYVIIAARHRRFLTQVGFPSYPHSCHCCYIVITTRHSRISYALLSENNHKTRVAPPWW